MARPLKEISQKDFEKLCGLQCTKEEICGFFDVTDKTLERWCRRTYKLGFSEVFAQKRGAGKISLRRSQFELAKKNANMAIWLGKQYLDQHIGRLVPPAEQEVGVLPPGAVGYDQLVLRPLLHNGQIRRDPVPQIEDHVSAQAFDGLAAYGELLAAERGHAPEDEADGHAHGLAGTD